MFISKTFSHPKVARRPLRIRALLAKLIRG
jgi:hypothetical protein